MEPERYRTTLYFIEDLVYDQYRTLSPYKNRAELLRQVLKDERRFRLKPRGRFGFLEKSRTMEVEKRLRKKLPLIHKRCGGD